MANIHHLGSMVPTKNTMPILTNFLVEADEVTKAVRFTATDLEITVVVEFEAIVQEGGMAAIPAKQFAAIVGTFPEADVELAQAGEFLQITCKNSNVKLLCADSAQFPLIPKKDLANAVSLNAHLFQKMVGTTMCAVSTEANRPIFTGIFWKLTPDGQIMAATDGKKIAEFKTAEPLAVSEAQEQILPTRGLNFLNRIINADCVELKVLLEKSRVMFEYDNYTIFSHTLEGKYPDYAKAIPENHKNALLGNKDALVSVLNRVAVLADDESGRVVFDLGNSIKLHAANRELGEAADELSDSTYSGEEMEIAFNYKLLLNIIKVMEGEKVQIMLGKNKEAILLFNPEVNEKYAARFLLMPLRMA